MKLSRKMSGGELDDRYPIRAGFARRWARAASGQAVAAPPISDMNSRRLMPNIGRSSRLGAVGRLAAPEVANDISGNITINQVLRLLYSDQLSPVEELFRHDNRFDSPALRD